MAGLSSMIRMRFAPSGPVLDMGGIHRGERKLENERCTTARPVAFHEQGAAEFLGGERPAMQAETVTGGTRREAMSEQAGHVFRGEAHAVDAPAQERHGR